MASETLGQVRLGGVVPRHIAVIMDGNGRWAAERGLPRRAGHRQGMEAVRETIEGSVEAGVEILTLFAFSMENWQRPATEISALMSLLQHYARSERDLLKARGVEVHVLGELDRMDQASRAAIDTIMGHENTTDMRVAYVEEISDDRLQTVTDHVRTWLFAEERQG